MRILLFTSEYPPRGDTNVIHSYAKEWVLNGEKVDIVYICDRLMFPLCLLSKRIEKRNPAGYSTKYIIDNVNVLKLGTSRFFPNSKTRTPSSLLIATYSLKKFLKGKEYDIVISHYPTNNLFFTKMARNNHTKILSVFHDCDIIDKKLLIDVIRTSDYVAVRSEKIKRIVEQYIQYPHDLRIISSGIPDEMVQNTFKPMNSSKGTIKICYVGKLIQRKNVDDIIKAVYELNKKYDVELEIIGEGSEEKTLKALAADLKIKNVDFLGFLPRNKAFEKMCNSDFFIMTSSNETFGLVYIEAMAAGCIVVGSKGEGIDGVIKNGENGFLVTPKHYLEVVDVVDHVMRSTPEDIKKIYDAMQNTIERYKESSIADEYLSFIECLVKNGD